MGSFLRINVLMLTFFYLLAFVCPVESCGRSFSVLSNMRRHARVHNVVPAEETADDGPSLSTPRWHQRRDSVASSSGSSSNSRRSGSVSPNDEEDRFAKQNWSKTG